MNKLPFALALLAVAAPAAAETLKAVPAALDPAKAYILVEYRLQENTFSPGLPGSRKYLPLTSGLVFARYDPVLGDVRGLGKAAANPVPGKQPIEPFRNREIAKADGARLFLIEVQPDTWIVQAAGGTSFSLGSYAFTLAPGTVTDLGVATPEPDYAEGERAMNTGDVFKMALLGGFGKRPPLVPMRVTFRPRRTGDMPLPAGLSAHAVRPVAFTANARFGNYTGGLVNRIEGVHARSRTVAPDH